MKRIGDASGAQLASSVALASSQPQLQIPEADETADISTRGKQAALALKFYCKVMAFAAHPSYANRISRRSAPGATDAGVSNYRFDDLLFTLAPGRAEQVPPCMAWS
jgi:hypothetical protein